MLRFPIFVVSLLLLLPGGTARGQVTLTVAGGLGFADRVFGQTNHTGGEDRPRSRHGRALSITAGLPVFGEWGIHLGASLSEKGYHSKHTCLSRLGEESPCTAENLIPYFESTVLAGRRFELTDRAMIHLLAGPFLGFQRDSVHEVWILREGESVRGLPRKVSAFDYGIAAGARLDIRVHGNLGLSVGTLYAHGFTKIDMVNAFRRGVVVPLTTWYFPVNAYAVKTRTLTFRTGLTYSIG